MLDAPAALALVLAGGDWRSPFYVFALTTLVLPATSLPWRAAVAWGLGFSAAYGGVALLTEKLPADTLTNTIRLETLATHLFVPVIITTTLAYSCLLLERLRPRAASPSAWRCRPSASASRGSCTTPPSSASTPRT